MRSPQLSAAIVCLALASLAAGARAGDASTDADQARYEIIAYVWGTSLALKADTPEGAISEHVSFSDILSNLSGALQAHARGEWGPWSADLDGFWSKLRGDNQSETVRLGPRGGIVIGAEAKTRLDQWIVQATGGHRLFQLGSPFSRRPTDTRHVTGELYGGVRYWSVDPKIQVQINSLELRIGDRTEWVDPLVGLRFGIDLSKTVVMVIAGDVGGFNIGDYCSDFTWSQLTSLSWAFSDSWTAHVGYKFLDFHRSARGVDQRMQMRGPFLAIGYRF